MLLRLEVKKQVFVDHGWICDSTPAFNTTSLETKYISEDEVDLTICDKSQNPREKTHASSFDFDSTSKTNIVDVNSIDLKMPDQ